MNASLIEISDCPIKFLITDCPDASRLSVYLQLLQSHSISLLFRLCDSDAYDITTLKESGIRVIDCPFADGSVPSKEILDVFRKELSATDASATIAIHCVSGIGRAPLLTAVAILERTNKSPEDVIDLIRSKRRGAFNKTQLNWLLDKKYLNKKKSWFKRIFGK